MTAAVADWIGTRWHVDGDSVGRILFWVAAGVLILAAWIRTWALAYLHAGVVYAPEVKTAALVADGPYRRVRNPLYFANVLLAVGFGSMMSRLGFILAMAAMLLFCYRLIFREESELQASQGEVYDAYRRAAPRMWPALWPNIAASRRAAKWSEGCKAESWYWGFAASVVAFALTLKLVYFFVILGASLALFGVLANMWKESAVRK